MANFNLNKITLGGRLTADPELKQTQSGVMVCSVGLAVNRRRSEDKQTDFFNLVVWRGTAEFLSKYFKKGSSICVVGPVQIRNWEDTNGNKRTSVDVVADEIYFVDGKNDNQISEELPEELPEDEDLPF